MTRLTKEERRTLFLEPYADWRFSGDAMRGYVLCGVSYPGQAEALRHLVKTVVPQLLDYLDAAEAEIADDQRLIEGYESVIVTQREEIARLTTAFEECDKREREAQEALKAMRDDNKELKATLRKMMREAEYAEVCIDGEFGACREASKLVAEGAMGEGYYEAKRLLEERGDAD